MKLKVFGGSSVGHRRQLRVIVLAASRTEAVAAFNAAGENVSYRYVHDYYLDTANVRELAVAEKAGRGVVLARGLDDFYGEYVPLKRAR